MAGECISNNSRREYIMLLCHIMGFISTGNVNSLHFSDWIYMHIEHVEIPNYFASVYSLKRDGIILYPS